MKKWLIINLMLLIFILPSLFAQTAVVREISGKVEIKPPGLGWTRATVGATVAKGAFISTGFKSQAILEMGPSVITVKALTRMRLDELVQKEGTMSTGLYLRTGKVGFNVKKGEGLTHDFKVRSPVSTAAVRGTQGETDGYWTQVTEGIVAFTNELGQTLEGLAGETIGFDAYGNAITFRDYLESQVQVVTQTGGSEGAGGGTAYVPGTVRVTWDN